MAAEYPSSEVNHLAAAKPVQVPLSDQVQPAQPAASIAPQAPAQTPPHAPAQTAPQAPAQAAPQAPEQTPAQVPAHNVSAVPQTNPAQERKGTYFVYQYLQTLTTV